jgi:hypothetical protein
MVKQESEFGKGTTYCLGLFLAHAERQVNNLSIRRGFSESLDIEMWFNGSSDHLYELQIPETFPKILQNKLKKFQRKCLNWEHGFNEKEMPTQEDKDWAISEAKELLRIIDKQNGIKTIRGQYK